MSRSKRDSRQGPEARVSGIGAWFSTPWRMVLAVLVVLSPLACAQKAYFDTPAAPASEKRGSGLSMTDATQLYNESKSQLMQRVNQEASSVHQPGATESEIRLACIAPNNLRRNAQGLYEISRGFPETDQRLDLGANHEWVASYAAWLNDEFSVFNDLVLVASAVPAERTAKELALTQGLTVLYGARSLLDMVEVVERDANCSFEPVEKHLDLVRNIANELSTSQLPSQLQALEGVGASPMDQMRYRVPLAVLSGRSASTECAEIDDRYQGHPDEALLLGWCGYDALRANNEPGARAFFERAKLIPGQPELSGYASKQLQSF